VVWWFLGFVFLVGFGMLGSLRGVFTPARNGRHQGQTSVSAQKEGAGTGL